MIDKNKLFDTHAHYYSRKFDELSGGVDGLLSSAEFQSSVGCVVNIGADVETSKAVVAQAKKYDFIYSAVGIHPTEAQNVCGEDVEGNLAKIEELLNTPEKRSENKIVAIGEIGFDYYWQPVDRELQYKYFYEQMRLAEKYGLPVIIHDRDAHGDTFDMICQFPNVRGILHSCSMSDEMVRQLCQRGWYISFSGTVTFKNAHKVKAACAVVPIDRLLSETDAPYLAPHPYRGQMNNSLLMENTVREMAEIHNISYEQMLQITNENARRIFSID
ncbi:MAG: TatD family deoxyribonuclease [Ruminococcaceae bacterium]|nr:TatD family deoxyribonuclease [Oscillospiraceae bacterium]